MKRKYIKPTMNDKNLYESHKRSLANQKTKHTNKSQFPVKKYTEREERNADSLNEYADSFNRSNLEYGMPSEVLSEINNLTDIEKEAIFGKDKSDNKAFLCIVDKLDHHVESFIISIDEKVAQPYIDSIGKEAYYKKAGNFILNILGDKDYISELEELTNMGVVLEYKKGDRPYVLKKNS